MITKEKLPDKVPMLLNNLKESDGWNPYDILIHFHHLIVLNTTRNVSSNITYIISMTCVEFIRRSFNAF